MPRSVWRYVTYLNHHLLHLNTTKFVYTDTQFLQTGLVCIQSKGNNPTLADFVVLAPGLALSMRHQLLTKRIWM